MLGVAWRCWFCSVGAVNFFTTQNTAQPAQAKSLILKHLQNLLWSLLHTVFSIALLALCCKCLIIIINNIIDIDIDKMCKLVLATFENNTPPKTVSWSKVYFLPAKQAKFLIKVLYETLFFDNENATRRFRSLSIDTT